MNCFFGHSFGKVETDGFQYCAKCGTAQKPTISHPCANGHVWTDEFIQKYTLTTYGYGNTERKQIQTFQKCINCGEKRTIWSQ